MNKNNRYDSLIEFYADKYELNSKLIKKQIQAESSFNPSATSPVGANGLMQFMPATWNEYGSGDVFNPEQSIEAGCKYMKYLMSKFNEIIDKNERYKFALASYNAGRGNVNKLLEISRQACGLPKSYSDWATFGSKGGAWQVWEFSSKFLEVITGRHSCETIGYVRKIMCEV